MNVVATRLLFPFRGKPPRSRCLHELVLSGEGLSFF